MHNVYVNYIVEYHDKIERGQIIAGKWIKKTYKILVDGIKSGDWDFDAKKQIRRSSLSKISATTQKGGMTFSSWNYGRKLLFRQSSEYWIKRRTDGSSGKSFF